MSWIVAHKADIAAIALFLLPHLIALIPPLAKGKNLITAVLNIIAGNYGAAKNAEIKDDKKKG